MALDGEAEAARGSEVQHPGIARDLADDEGQFAAAQPFLQREQRILGRAGRDMD